MVAATMDLQLEDFTGQIRRRARRVPRDATISELLTNVADELHLEQVDASGRPVIYGARSSRGDVLNGSDRVGDVLEEEEVVTLTKSVTAG